MSELEGYYVHARFVTDSGFEYVEEYENLSLSDFEEIYGKWTDNLLVLKIELRVEGV